ncbi:MAG: hypothetical protein FJ316_00455 [SAR202 cluster bacterium]|nr:hypothetical protein [SAR202 cluster bacterium]
MTASRQYVLELPHLQLLLDALQGRGYQVIGPVLRQDAIVYDRLDSIEDLPIGWSDEQDGGQYRLIKRDDQALFGYAVGPHSWKKFLFPPERRLWSARRDASGFHFIFPLTTP